MVDPQAARANFERLAGARRARPLRLLRGARLHADAACRTANSVAIVRAFMAHHQGMTIVAIANALLDGAMRARFHAEPMHPGDGIAVCRSACRATSSVVHPGRAEVQSPPAGRDVEPPGRPALRRPHSATPATHLLSNGRYSMMLTAAGLRLQPLGRPRGDALARRRHLRRLRLLYLPAGRAQRRRLVGRLISRAASSPTTMTSPSTRIAPNSSRRDGTLTTTLEVAGLRRGRRRSPPRLDHQYTARASREIEVTSYAELALAPQAADVAHPAFSKLFVETEFRRRTSARFWRRAAGARRTSRRSGPRIWRSSTAKPSASREFETDRARFLGRGQGDPHADRGDRRARRSRTRSARCSTRSSRLRRRVRIAPGATARIAFWTMAASTREPLLDLVDKHHDATAFDARGDARLDAGAGAVAPSRHRPPARPACSSAWPAMCSTPTPRCGRRPTTIQRGARGAIGLWALGISGDLPIVLLRIADIETISTSRASLLQAHEYWRMKRLAVDLVILNERASSYVQDLQIALETLVRTSQSRPQIRGDESAAARVFVLRADLIAPETPALLASVARVVLVAQRGGLFDQLDRIARAQ